MIRSVRAVKGDVKMTFQGEKGGREEILRFQEDNCMAFL